MQPGANTSKCVLPSPHLACTPTNINLGHHPVQVHQAANTEPATAATPSSTSSAPEDIVRAFYTAVNKKDINTALEYIAADILYEDFTYPEPKVGKGAVEAFLQDVCALVPDGLDYVVDDITSGDDSKVGVVW